MFTTANHEQYMRRAIAQGCQVPRLPFGAVLVDPHRRRVVAAGYNRTAENPLWHGEMDAINHCAAAHPDIDWSRLILYTTAEPCAMCQGGIIWAGIGRVVYGTSLRTLMKMGWDLIDLCAAEMMRRAPFRECRLLGGVLEKECDELFREAIAARR